MLLQANTIGHIHTQTVTLTHAYLEKRCGGSRGVGPCVVLLEVCQVGVLPEERDEVSLQHLLVRGSVDRPVEKVEGRSMVMAESGPHHDTPSSKAVCFKDAVVCIPFTNATPNSDPPVCSRQGKPRFIAENYSGPLPSQPPPVHGCPLHTTDAVCAGGLGLGQQRGVVHEGLLLEDDAKLC